MSLADTHSVWLYSQTRNVAQRLLLLAIADGINKNDDHYYGKVEKLAYKIGGKSERYVQKLLNELVILGELVIVERPKTTSQYYIPLYPGEYGFNPQPCDGKKHRCNGCHTSIDKDRETWEIEYAEKARKEHQGRTIVHPSNPSRVNPSSPIRVNPSSPQGEPQFTDKGEPQFTPGRTPVHPEPIRESRSKKQEDKPMRAQATEPGASDISFQNQKQKTEMAERTHSKPATLATPQAIETDARTAEPPTPQPPAPAPRTLQQEFTAWLDHAEFTAVPGQRMVSIEKRQYENRSFKRFTHQEVMDAFLASRQRQEVAV